MSDAKEWVTVKTNSGISTIRIDEIAAIVKVPYEEVIIEVHLRSGSIFTITDEADKDIFEWFVNAKTGEN
tara:strand:- start:1118 stop:1327 length:210 start_codon:yes stop_codon:yes gene_type:complete